MEEGYDMNGVSFGPNFGCIHFEAKYDLYAQPEEVQSYSGGDNLRATFNKGDYASLSGRTFRANDHGLVAVGNEDDVYPIIEKP
jgi:hypothetical protein